MTSAARAGRALDIVLADLRPEPGRGVAYSTPDRRHLLNVPAGGMSALPERPGHLVEWLQGHGHPTATPADFVPRADCGRYLWDTLAEALRNTDAVTVEHRCQRVRHARPVPGGVHLAFADGSVLTADAMVLAPGFFAPGTAWAPTALTSSDRFVADPWAPGALERLTMVDVALSLARPGRTLHAVSRRGRVDRRPPPAGPAPPYLRRPRHRLTGPPAALARPAARPPPFDHVWQACRHFARCLCLAKYPPACHTWSTPGGGAIPYRGN